MTSFIFKIGSSPKFKKLFFQMSYVYFHKTDNATIYFKYFTCPKCKSKYFDEDLFLHGLEHEIVEIQCAKIIGHEKYYARGFDMMALKWHLFKLFHNCPKDLNLSHFNIS